MPADTTILRADRVLRPDGRLAPGWVTVTAGRITAVSEHRPAGTDAAAVHDLEGTLAPGYVDLQFNGAHGIDLGAADFDDWQQVLRRLPASGVTSILATFVSAPAERLLAMLDVARQAGSRNDPTSAHLAGVHLEGPYLAPDWRGAHQPAFLRLPDPVLTDTLLEVGRGLLAMMTLAPELEGAGACIETLTRAGVVVAIGHTGADAAAVSAAADRGARLVTHLYNAQTPLHHRNPGVVGQALTDPRLAVSIIADLEHVAPAPLRLAFSSKPRKVALVTDCVAAAGMTTGSHLMPDGEVLVNEGRAPRRPDGTLAGSALRMDSAVRNAVAVGVPVADALMAASTVPATLLGRTDIGRIQPGARADLVELDAELRPVRVWVGGACVFDVTSSTFVSGPAL
ncbi:MAG TPA: N-acetylglucosamine-6-phosphate deacetylase [Propionicimonas sp.]|jgi:N-acetylglucosamine-6-phosphate deacetylase